MKKLALDAKDLLVSKEGAGNDFLGWIDLPVDYDKEEEFIEEWEVTRVGKKYVYAKKKNTNSIEVAFSKLNYLPYHWIEKTNTLFFNYLLYGTREELEEYLEKDHLQQIISKFFQGYGGKGLSLLQLRQIEEIIDRSSK